MSQFTHLALIRQDARYTLRILRKQPAFAATAILTLALAIGGNTAMFAIIQAVLLKPLPYPHPDQLVSISGGATPTRLLEMQASARTLTAIGAYTGEETPTLSIASEPQVIKAARVSANFLQILQVNPLLGRSFRPDEDSPANPPVVMISAGLWQRAFSADPYILNRTATLGGAPYSIIGVLPPRFAFPSPGLDIWLTAPSEWPLMPAKSRVMSPFLTLFGRMKPDITLAQANAEAKVIQHQYAVAHPAMFDAKPKSPEQITPMKDGLVSNIRAMLYMLMGTVAFVLLIACANVAGLLLARATARSREIALRSALGAARLRLIGQFLIESVVLSLSGGLLGVLLAFWCIRGIPALHAFELPRAQEIHLDGLVLVFAAAVSILTGLLFGIAPALHASRTDLAQMLRMSGASAAGHQAPSSGPSMRGLLLVAQVSLSVVLLVGTALLLQSVSHLRGVSIGFNPASVLTASVSLPTARYDTIPKRALFWEQLVQRIRATPGVRSAAASMFLPMMGYAGSPVQDAAKPLLKLNERLIATLCVVTPRYFETLEIPMRRGRDFNERDKEESQRVAIIDETTARRFWPDYPHGLDPIGQHIWVGGINPRPAEIVGIVANIHQSLENTAWPETVYVAFAQAPQPFAMLAVRTQQDNPLALTSALREQVRSLDNDQAISAVRSMEDLVDDQIGQRRLLATLLGGFAAMALLLVLMGIYGIIAYSVTERTQELGIRRALGAQPSDILRLVVGQSFRYALAGVALGIAGSFALTRLMEKMLFHISPTDPTTFLIVTILFLAIALLASYLPARRATRIDPALALRL